jgi:hypothetical protein
MYTYTNIQISFLPHNHQKKFKLYLNKTKQKVFFIHLAFINFLSKIFLSIKMISMLIFIYIFLFLIIFLETKLIA